MRKILLIFCFSLFLFSCSDDDKASAVDDKDIVPEVPKTVKVGDVDYFVNMPVISTKSVEIINHLKEVRANYTDNTEANFRTIVAELPVAVDLNMDNLFKKVTFYIKYVQSTVEYISLDLEYNGLKKGEKPDENLKKFVNDYISKKCFIEF
ncbi:MAG: hypothetical protein N4A49_12925 [Marinifilaceae bacterium]|nr:hypothetical protein [Marinifilaceae bacterium]